MYKINTGPGPKFNFPGIDSNRRLTKIFSASLKRSWIHPYIRIRRFIHDYSLPVIVTGIFLLVVAGALILKVSQRSALANLLASVTDSGQDYGTLLSKDKNEDLKKNNDSDPATTPIGTTVVGGGASFAVNTSGNNNPAAPSGSSPAPSGNGGGATVMQAFSASVTYIRQDSSTLECTTPKPKQQTCSKRYVFGAGINSKNGPGTVSYSWRSSMQSLVQNSSYSASSGDVTQTLQKTVTLLCTEPTTFTLQMAVTSPLSSQSAVLNTNHNCNEI